MEIIDKYTKMIMSATKAGEKDKANVYKLIKAKMLEFVTAKNAGVLNESAEVTILNKMMKERIDTTTVYINAGRIDLADKETLEANIIKELLPPEVSKEDIEAYVSYWYPNGIEKKSMGLVIKEIKEKYIGVDGKLVADIVKNNLI